MLMHDSCIDIFVIYHHSVVLVNEKIQEPVEVVEHFTVKLTTEAYFENHRQSCG